MSPTQKQLLEEVHEMLKRTIERQNTMEEELKKINEKLDILQNNGSTHTNMDTQITQTTLEEEFKKINEKLEKIHENKNSHSDGDNQTSQSELIKEYIAKNYGHLKDMDSYYIKQESYKIRKYQLKMWRSSLNRRKIIYYNAIRSNTVATIYNSFLSSEEIFIPKKFREKVTKQDSQEQMKIKKELSIQKLQAQIKIMEIKTIQYTKKYQEIDEELLKNIKESSPERFQHSLFDLWKSDCQKEEEKSIKILQKKKEWLTNLPEKEKEREKEEREKKEKREQKNNQLEQKGGHTPSHTQNDHNQGRETKFLKSNYKPHRKYSKQQKFNQKNKNKNGHNHNRNKYTRVRKQFSSHSNRTGRSKWNSNKKNTSPKRKKPTPNTRNRFQHNKTRTQNNKGTCNRNFLGRKQQVRDPF